MFDPHKGQDVQSRSIELPHLLQTFVFVLNDESSLRRVEAAIGGVFRYESVRLYPRFIESVDVLSEIGRGYRLIFSGGLIVAAL
jgi:hypothetical protein